MADPVRKSVTVPLDRFSAFDLFANGIDRWWPKESHSLAAGRGEGDRTRVRTEPRPGGRIVETLPDGSEAPWATITRWEPGTALALDWHVGRELAEATRIVVTFTQGDAGTRVDLVHSGFDALGPNAGAVSAGYDTGWEMVLGLRFAAACRAAGADQAATSGEVVGK